MVIPSAFWYTKVCAENFTSGGKCATISQNVSFGGIYTIRAIVTVIGPDNKGLIAKVCGLLADRDVNIIDISQTVMKEFFTMTMLVDTSDATDSFDMIAEALKAKGEEMGLSIRIQNEDIFNAMHKI